MTNLYSLNHDWPKPLSFRVRTADGSSRTDPSTFTPEELREWGYTGPYSKPEFDSQTEALEWTGTGFEIRPLNPQELQLEFDRKAAEVRQYRNALLAHSDWTQLSDAPVDRSAWAVYRQSLRDVTAQAGFPGSVDWPEMP